MIIYAYIIIMICTHDGMLWLPKLICNKKYKLFWCIKHYFLFIYRRSYYLANLFIAITLFSVENKNSKNSVTIQ